MIVETKCFEVELSYKQELTSAQLAYISEWISASGELPLISGNKKNHLSHLELGSWIKSSFQCVIVLHNEEIIGIATLSISEAELPSDAIEICHCIVHPKFRRLYNGSSLVINLTAFAKQNGFSRIVGRVVKTNLVGFALLKELHWRPLKTNFSNDDSVLWMEKIFI